MESVFCINVALNKRKFWHYHYPDRGGISFIINDNIGRNFQHLANSNVQLVVAEKKETIFMAQNMETGALFEKTGQWMDG